MFFKLIVAAHLAAAIYGVIYLVPPVMAPAPPPHVDCVTNIGAAADLNGQWEKTFDKTGKYPDKQDPGWHNLMYGLLLKLPEGDPNYPAARALIAKYALRQIKFNDVEKKARLVRVSNDADGRARFADRLDTTFLKAGKDASFKVSGTKNTALEMNYVLINRPAVYQITNETSFLRDAWEAGFRRVIFRSGYLSGGDAWTYDVHKHFPR